ncbi:response regulator [Kordia sp. YSTF-M3]|uniref:histidine kinase n=1 Tax=Kordia aestuariivivens TaxID=2759037 RepID=A0ABR7QEE9_9FLAO|nr:ATP-binding protein [Kordia aestuariivivens]MBC8756907.1 response regulator [Kordia aestuariivivens]
MKKTYLLISLIFVCTLHSKNKYERKDPSYLQALYEKMRQEVSKVSIDTTLLRAEKILNQFRRKNTFTPIEYSMVKKIHSATMLFLMDQHTIQRQYDSVQYYHAMIKEKIADNEVLGSAQLYLFESKISEKEYFKAITCLYKGLEHFKEIEATDKEILVYLKLAALYKKTNCKELSKEMDSILMNTYLHKDIPKSLKTRILINHASYIAIQGDPQNAIQVLKNINIRGFRNNPCLKKKYNKELACRYLKLKEVDSAKKYVKIAYENSNAAYLDDGATKNIFYAFIYFIDKNYIKAKRHLDLAKKSNARYHAEQFTRIKLNKLEFLINKELGRHDKALAAYEKYVSVRDSLKNFNLNMNASVLNFKLSRDKKIKVLEEKSETMDLVLEEKKKFYIFSTFLVSVSVSIFIFIIILHQRRKKQLKLLFENEKMKDIATIKNNFIENLSHEIRTPITITTGYLRLITNNAMDYSKIIKYADLTVRNNEQIIQMLNNFLTLLKQEKNLTTYKVTSDKMEEFLKEVVYSFQGVAEIKGVPIYYKSNIKPNQLLDYNYDDLRKIVNNLISNALKYTNPTNGIYVNAFINENGLNLIVRDEGIGIDKEEQKLIFDRFYQSKSHSLTGGFGIGLSLVHELVTKLKGTITLDSKKGIGSIFTILVPLAVENHLLYVDENTSKYRNIYTSKTIDPVIACKLPKILIVDDNIEMIGYLKELLSPILNCTFAFDGIQALSFANKTQYDVILSDLRMPVMDGHELKVALNTLPNYEAVPYIMMTASAEEYIENNKSVLGINDYLIKPFESMELITRINFHLEKNIYKKQLQSIENETITFNGAYSEFMDKINNIILENITNNEFTIHELAMQCGYSRKQFTQIVQEKTGLSPVKIILEVRLRKAYDLVVTDKYQSISEVLYTVGLNSRTYFNKVFAKRFGIKPGELIKKVKVENLV